MEILHFARYEIWQANEIVRIRIILFRSFKDFQVHCYRQWGPCNDVGMSRILATISCHESAILDIVNNDEKIVFNIFANPHKQQRSRNDKMIFNQSFAHAEKEILSKTPLIAFSKGQSKEFVVFDL